MLSRPCLPQVIRDFRIDTICESAVSASHREMASGDMGIVWFAGDIIRQELAEQQLIACARELKEIELDISPYYHDAGLPKQLGELILAMVRRS